MSIKKFHIGDVLSITSDYLVSPRLIDGVYDICSWMTGEDVYTHQLPRVAAEIEDNLRRQHPGLAAVEVPGGMSSEAEVLAFLSGLYGEFGEYVDVAPLADRRDHTSIDPIAEVRMINPSVTVIGLDGEATR